METAAKDRTSADRCVLRREHAAPILAEFGSWLEREQPAVLPKSPIGEALRYMQNQWAALSRNVEDGDLSIDSNVSERTVTIAALGRNYAESHAMRSCLGINPRVSLFSRAAVTLSRC